MSCSSGSTSGISPENRRERGGKVGVHDRKQDCISSEVGLGRRRALQIIVWAAPTTQAQAGGLREGVKGTKGLLCWEFTVCSGKNKAAAEQSCSLGVGTATWATVVALRPTTTRVKGLFI